ncbi:tyrosinase [Muriicola jejuensis]|nr:tyrosinase [Muriicola jejuensis]
MLRSLLTILVLLMVLNQSEAQSIRKSYHEMSASERDALVGAFHQMRLGGDLINDLAQFHSDFFNLDGVGDGTQLDIHFNLPDEPQRQIFFPWHRMQIFEMEQAMQVINPNISMPWWDSSVDQSTDPNSLLWSASFMGQFDQAWQLNRNLGGSGPLPTPTDVINLQAISDFLVYSNQMERGPVHRGAHVWVGGAMPTTLSPRDPIFYLHHTNIDRLWAVWEDANPGGSSHIITSMIRYDGTYVFDGVTLPLVDPDDIVNTRALGVFYANNQLAQLSDYTVSNTHKPLENFYYQFLIEAGNDFIVPSGTNCKLESVNEIRLIPGFIAESGASFIAKIDADNNVNTAGKPGPNTSPLVRVERPFEYDEAILYKDAYDPREFVSGNIDINLYPNPFLESIVVDMDKVYSEFKISLFDMSGRRLLLKSFERQKTIDLTGLQTLAKGIYVLEVMVNGEVVLRKKIIKE